MAARSALRDRESIAAQIAALRGDAAEFERGALAALCWLLEGGPGPVTDEPSVRPGTPRAIVRELAAAEAVIYGASTERTDFARGVEHALMWAQFVTCCGPADVSQAGG
jgi:hypothetical protein